MLEWKEVQERDPEDSSHWSVQGCMQKQQLQSKHAVCSAALDLAICLCPLSLGCALSFWVTLSLQVVPSPSQCSCPSLSGTLFLCAANATQVPAQMPHERLRSIRGPLHTHASARSPQAQEHESKQSPSSKQPQSPAALKLPKAYRPQSLPPEAACHGSSHSTHNLKGRAVLRLAKAEQSTDAL